MYLIIIVWFMVLGIFRSKPKFSSFQKTCKCWPSYTLLLGFPCGWAGKESACNAGYLGLIPGLGKSRGEGKVYPLQYSGLEDSVNYPWNHKQSNTTENFHLHFHYPTFNPKSKPVNSVWLRGFKIANAHLFPEFLAEVSLTISRKKKK